MEIGHLDAFVSAADAGSFSRAAERLGVAQPSLSNRIQTLEREVGQALFERLGRGVKLTDAGRSFLPYAQRVLRTLDDGVRVLEGSREGTGGQLVVGTAPAVGTYILPRLLKVFAGTHPGVEVSVRTGHTEDVLQLVLDDDVQLGLGRPVTHPEIATVDLYSDALVLVVASNHRYARRGVVDVEDVVDEPLILFDRDSSYYGMIMNTFRELGATPHHQLQMDSIEATKKMVEANVGIALLPSVSVEREIRLGTLHKVHLGIDAPLNRVTSVMYRRGKPQTGAVSSFLQMLSEIYGAELAL